MEKHQMVHTRALRLQDNIIIFILSWRLGKWMSLGGFKFVVIALLFRLLAHALLICRYRTGPGKVDPGPFSSRCELSWFMRSLLGGCQDPNCFFFDGSLGFRATCLHIACINWRPWFQQKKGICFINFQCAGSAQMTSRVIESSDGDHNGDFET